MPGPPEGGDPGASRPDDRPTNEDTRSGNGLPRVAVDDLNGEVRGSRSLDLLGGLDRGRRRSDGRLVTAGAGTKAGGNRARKDE